ncbi:MAG: radical SAM protein [Elusimicrobiota bacterium]
MKPRRIPKIEPITLSDTCNQRCLFCSAYRAMPAHTDAQIAAIIARSDRQVIIGGWEPTVSARLEKVVRQAASAGIQSIAVFTNAIRLSDKKYADRLIDAGVTIFNINFPAHTRKLSDSITQTPGAFEKRVSAIKHLLTRRDRTAVSLCFVVSSVNYKILPAYAEYVADNFPGIEHVTLNMVCVSGWASIAVSLVPKLSDIEPYLKAATAIFMKRRVTCIIDNVPLCRMRGFEYASVAARYIVVDGAKSVAADKTYLRAACCAKCKLKQICLGLRQDYYNLNGSEELMPSRKSARSITMKILEGKREKPR